MEEGRRDDSIAVVLRSSIYFNKIFHEIIGFDLTYRFPLIIFYGSAAISVFLEGIEPSRRYAAPGVTKKV